MNVVEFEQIIRCFMSDLNSRNVEIYNEFSLQFELGIYLRNELQNAFPTSGYKVQFERNISFFDLTNKSIKWKKKEIDIVVFNDVEKYAIELKFPPINSAVNHRMKQFIDDIHFLEQLKDAGFDGCCALTLVSNHGYFLVNKTLSFNKSLYDCFRSPNFEVKIPSSILHVQDSFITKWIPILISGNNNPIRYYIISM